VRAVRLPMSSGRATNGLLWKHRLCREVRPAKAFWEGHQAAAGYH